MGGIQMRLRIKQRKLEFIWHLNNLGDETLAKEIMMVQRTHCLPGLVKECQDWIEELNLPDIFQTKITKKQWKKMIKDKILKQNETELKSKMLNLEKLKNSKLVTEKFGVKPYVKTLTVYEARSR